MSKLWGRFGMSFAITEKDEKELIKAQKAGNMEEVLCRLIAEGKAAFDGDCYFPAGFHPFGGGDYYAFILDLDIPSFKTKN